MTVRDDERLAAAFRIQSVAFAQADATLSQRLCAAAQESVRERGVVAELWSDWSGDPVLGYFPLRVVAAGHALALRGDAPALASHYPSCGGSPSDVEPAFLAALAAHPRDTHRRLAFGPQTNEVGRSGALFGGFHHVAGRTKLPLRLLELGASAGLNLCWDQYRYVLGETRWGRADSPVELRPEWSGGSPAVAEHLVVAERRGCDLHPIDLRSDEDRLRLESYVWAEQPERLARLRAAVMLAEKIAPRVDARSAPDWLGERLAERSPGLVDVVFHSAFWPYLDEAAQHQVREAMARAGERASERAPLAWLRYEGLSKEMTLALDLWPGGESWTLAHGENRGRFVRWGAS